MEGKNFKNLNDVLKDASNEDIWMLLNQMSQIMQGSMADLVLKPKEDYNKDELGTTENEIALAINMYNKLGIYNYNLIPNYIPAIKNWKGQVDINESKKYVYNGEMKDEKFHGIGILITGEFLICEGFWSNGVQQGPGRSIDPKIKYSL